MVLIMDTEDVDLADTPLDEGRYLVHLLFVIFTKLGVGTFEDVVL